MTPRVVSSSPVSSQIFRPDRTSDVLDRAATLAPVHLVPSLDAAHIASAEVLRADLRSLVTYDLQMSATAAEIGLPVASPV